jgi:predicted dienelactone hydrolase
MRILEALILITLFLSMSRYLLQTQRRPRWMDWLPVLALVLVGVQLVVDGYRWAMGPAYLLAGFSFLVSVQSLWLGRNVQQAEVPSWQKALKISGLVAGWLLLAAAIILPFAFPLFSLPQPSGTYPVGTRYFYWPDLERPDTGTDDPADYRSVSVQIWYPAEQPEDQQPVPYMTLEAGRAFASFLDLPSWFFQHFALVPTHSYLDAAPADTQAPFHVITYSTSGLMSSHISLFEELASQGYVVACIGHPYWNPFVYGEGGEIIVLDEEHPLYKDWWAEENDLVKMAKRQITTAKNLDEMRRAERWHNELKPIAIQDLGNWSQDIGFVLDNLADLNQPGEFFDEMLDLNQVGVMGFSKGGAAAGQFCLDDERCAAGINLTGFMYGDILDENLQVPFLFFSEEETWCPDCYVNQLFYQQAQDSAYQIKVRGARHSSFGDPCLWGGLLSSIGSDATIDGQQMAHLQTAYSLAFFNQHLRDLSSELLAGPSAEFPQVVFESRNP